MRCDDTQTDEVVCGNRKWAKSYNNFLWLQTLSEIFGWKKVCGSHPADLGQHTYTHHSDRRSSHWNDARGHDYVFTTALMAAAENRFNFTKEITAQRQYVPGAQECRVRCDDAPSSRQWHDSHLFFGRSAAAASTSLALSKITMSPLDSWFGWCDEVVIIIW